MHGPVARLLRSFLAAGRSTTTWRDRGVWTGSGPVAGFLAFAIAGPVRRGVVAQSNPCEGIHRLVSVRSFADISPDRNVSGKGAARKRSHASPWASECSGGSDPAFFRSEPEECDHGVPFAESCDSCEPDWWVDERSQLDADADEYPLVMGGQGRDADDMRDGAGAIAWMVGAVVFLFAALAVWGCM